MNCDATLPVGPAKRVGTTLRRDRTGGAATHATPSLTMLVTFDRPAADVHTRCHRSWHRPRRHVPVMSMSPRSRPGILTSRSVAPRRVISVLGLRARSAHRQPHVCKFLESEHGRLKRQVIQWTVYLVVCKLFNASM